ncbi:hypothetical protein [Aliivibrio fischeri]|uniref:hypothetical protein n=1 Tax=Aliivibrio fischeri TaxID=668 RepID=UPI00080EAED8|nr:hypothetical protein [Aliivibrio fischeri]OCH48780.1 hypothetical protein A6E02_08040 [Aliivibrio fischeri]
MLYIENINNFKINYSGNVDVTSKEYSLISGKNKCTYNLCDFIVSYFSYSKKYQLITIKLENNIELYPIDFKTEEICFLNANITIKYCVVIRKVIGIYFDDESKNISAELHDFEFNIDFIKTF